MDEDRRQQLQERYHRRNALNLTLVEVGWGLGMAFFAIEAIVNPLLRRLGASYIVLGIIPAFWALGSFLPPILAGYMTQHLERKKRMVVIWHFVPPAFVLACGLFVYLGVGRIPMPAFIPAIVILMGGYWSFMGFLFPIYVNFIAKVLDTRKRGLAFGSIFAAQCTFGALGTYLAASLLGGAYGATGVVKTMPPEVIAKYGLCFIVGACVIVFGNLFFFPIKELRERDTEPQAGIKKYLASFVQIFREEKNLRNYTIARYFILTYVFYLYTYPSHIWDKFPTLATPANLASLATFSFIGMAIGYFISGLLSVRIAYKSIALFGNLVLLGDLVLFLNADSLFQFFLVALFIGVFIGIERYYNFNLVMEICRKEDKTKYLVLATLLQAPAMALAVFVGGLFVDLIGETNDGYRIVIMASCGLAVLGTVVLQFMVRLRRSDLPD